MKYGSGKTSLGLRKTSNGWVTTGTLNLVWSRMRLIGQIEKDVAQGQSIVLLACPVRFLSVNVEILKRRR
ncbi:MAG: hypothetical protein CMJ81_12005 [Planctomycetaceae bacterium]|nr:hypothetical protein [Planctomycetaceae bacterium]